MDLVWALNGRVGRGPGRTGRAETGPTDGRTDGSSSGGPAAAEPPPTLILSLAAWVLSGSGSGGNVLGADRKLIRRQEKGAQTIPARTNRRSPLLQLHLRHTNIEKHSSQINRNHVERLI